MLIKTITSESEWKEVTLKWWIEHKRSSWKIMFIVLRDWTGVIQLIIEKNNIWEKIFDELSSIGIESSISVTWNVSKHPKKDEFEIHVKSTSIITKTSDYPISEQEHGVSFLLDHRDLWLRSKRQWAIQRIRHTINYAIYDFMRDNDFLRFDSPIFTPSACEGTTDLFEVPYVDGNSVYLGQTGQLYLEAWIMAHNRVYDFAPVFRAEKSKTRRHLNEFWMMDAEMAFVEHEWNLEIQEQLMYYIIQEVLKKNKNDLTILERDISKLEAIKLPFERISYEDIIKELQGMWSDIKAWEDLWWDDEEILMNKYTQPIFIEKYPKEVKAFYMKEDPLDSTKVLNSDLLAPEWYGEIFWWSERESDYEKLLKRINDHKLPVEQFQWYLDTRKYWWVPHSGFWLGLERIVRWLSGIHHVRETIPFPRTLYRTTP